ncbi:MAG: hypothetical protein JOZ65_07460 [Chloroflexi bacterium]|nr:hypothetical protein [Chloroflexota bacterium]
MPNQTDFLNTELETLEQDLGPSLREALQAQQLRPEFAASLRTELNQLPSRARRGHLRLVPRRAWAAIAAVVVVGLTASSAALFATRAQPASAAAIEQLQSEAVTALSASGGPCADKPADGTVGVAIAQTADGQPPSPGTVQVQGPQTLSSTDLSDKLAEALGVSGAKVRQAMVDTMREEMPASLPPDPIDGIAQNLGVTRQQVCSAFFDGESGGEPQVVGISARRAADGSDSNVTAFDQVHLGSIVFDPNTVTAQQLAAPAQRLGVSPDRLLAAVKASLPAKMAAPPTPPNKDEIINRFAANLGMSPDKVRDAITQVEGPHLFYFGGPLSFSRQR